MYRPSFPDGREEEIRAAGEFEAASEGLTRPDAPQHLAELVETTELEGVYEDLFDETSV